MTPTEEEVNRILEADLETLYKLFRLLKTESGTLQKEYEKARYGIKTKFSIHDIIEGRYKEKEKAGTIIIKGEEIEIEEYRTEIEEREDLMRTTLIENTRTNNKLEGR